MALCAPYQQTRSRNIVIVSDGYISPIYPNLSTVICILTFYPLILSTDRSPITPPFRPLLNKPLKCLPITTPLNPILAPTHDLVFPIHYRPNVIPIAFAVEPLECNVT